MIMDTLNIHVPRVTPLVSREHYILAKNASKWMILRAI
jgi:hypothetical protein